MDKSTDNYHQQWRLLKDKIARYGVIAGGLSIIGAVVLIFFYLLYVVFPLFLSASAESVASYNVPEQTLGKTLLLEIEEQNEMAARFTDNGQVVFFNVADGKTVLTQAIKIPENTHIVSFAQGSPINEGAVIYGLSNGQAIVVKHQYKVTYPNNKRLITPSLKYPLGEAPLVIDETGAALGDKIAVKIGDSSSTIASKTADDKVRLISFAKEQGLFADENALTRTEAVLDHSSNQYCRIVNR